MFNTMEFDNIISNNKKIIKEKIKAMSIVKCTLWSRHLKSIPIGYF